VGHLLGYTVDDCVLLRFSYSAGPEVVSLTEATPLKMGESSTQLSWGHPQNGHRMFVTGRGYAGAIGKVVTIVAHRSTDVVLLEEAKYDVTIGKKFLLLATVVELDPWTAAEEK
jgi:hypothetical protein